MIPATYDFTMVRGTTSPFVFRLQSGDPPEPIPLTDIHISIYNRSTQLVRKKLSDADGLALTDALSGEYTWTPTPAETRALKEGAKNSYEVEVWNGSSQLVYLIGTITGLGGLNDD